MLPPLSLTELIEKMLINSLDYGISELEFWDMTPGEVSRLVQSRAKVRRLEAQERATHDYILANLIIKGIGMTLGSKEKFPTVQEAYPGLFDEPAEDKREEIAQQKMTLSALRFREFAQSYNNKFKDKEVPNKADE